MIIQILDVTARLEGASVRVEVIMGDRLLDPHTQTHVLLREGVNGINKVGIIRRQPVSVGHSFE